MPRIKSLNLVLDLVLYPCLCLNTFIRSNSPNLDRDVGPSALTTGVSETLSFCVQNASSLFHLTFKRILAFYSPFSFPFSALELPQPSHESHPRFIFSSSFPASALRRSAVCSVAVRASLYRFSVEPRTFARDSLVESLTEPYFASALSARPCARVAASPATSSMLERAESILL